ncbi:RNA-binding Raly-like protein [Betta splendens]|uniref:RNA-binding Raly-like protein n=1 Tax=Betta splendens TaxID=158456 RepID=A0A6P7MUF0_BETSP|nr:RNA-binding Raly-like protein [Betta splendens]
MTHFRSDCHLDRHGMNGRTPSAKRGSSISDRSDYEVEYGRNADDYNRVFDYQRVPSSVPAEPRPVKRARPSSSSSSSSSSAALRMKRSRGSSRSSHTHTSPSGSSEAELKMEELLAIKRELTVIKVQIDGLLDCVNKMDKQRKDGSERPHSREPSVSGSPHRGSVSSLERESPEPGEASDDEPLPYQQFYSRRIKQHQAGLDDDL